MNTPSSYEEFPIDGKEGFLFGLSEIDRANVEKLTRLFQQAMTDQDKKGTLLAPAGILLRPLDRPDTPPDIFLRIVLQPQDPKQKYSDAHTAARAEFPVFREVIGAIAEASNGQLQIGKTYQPAMDEQYGDNPDILKNSGSVELTDQHGQGSTIWIIMEKYAADALNNKEYVVLAAV